MGPTTAAMIFTADLDQWAACGTQLVLLGAAEIVRLSERGSGGKSKRKSADKTRFDKTAFHECTPFELRLSGEGEMFMKLENENAEYFAFPIEINSAMYRGAPLPIEPHLF